MTAETVCPGCQQKNESTRTYCWACYYSFVSLTSSETPANPLKDFLTRTADPDEVKQRRSSGLRWLLLPVIAFYIFYDGMIINTKLLISFPALSSYLAIPILIGLSVAAGGSWLLLRLVENKMSQQGKSNSLVPLMVLCAALIFIAFTDRTIMNHRRRQTMKEVNKQRKEIEKMMQEHEKIKKFLETQATPRP